MSSKKEIKVSKCSTYVPDNDAEVLEFSSVIVILLYPNYPQIL